jgi:hypothetical protein
VGFTTTRAVRYGPPWRPCVFVNVVNSLPAKGDMTVKQWAEAAVLWVLQRGHAPAALMGHLTGIGRPTDVVTELKRRGLVRDAGTTGDVGWDASGREGRPAFLYALTGDGEKAAAELGALDPYIDDELCVEVDERLFAPSAMPAVIAGHVQAALAIASFG